MTRLGPSKIHGTGVFAECGIIRGALIGTVEGRIVADYSDKNLFGTHNLCLPDSRGRSWLLIAELPFSHLNHADTPNCVLDGPNLYALRRIAAGEELTIDYGASDETERPKLQKQSIFSGGENGTEDETDGC